MLYKGVAFLALLAAFEVVSGYQLGAPKEACGDMTPQHHTKPQETPFPYIVQVSKTIIRPTEKVVVTISGGKTHKNFKGFLVQARVGNTPVGKFERAPNVKLVDCGNTKNSAATHDKATVKDKVVLTWIPPPNLTETVTFKVTVAKDGGTFWVGYDAATVRVKKN